jgi:pyruvate,water dikinase
MDYMPLREDQRFQWQQTLALQRQLVLWLGKQWVKRGVLSRPEEVFFATLEELQASVVGEALPANLWRQRRAEYDRLIHEHREAPQASYPGFLLGDRPLVEELEDGTRSLWGQGVSPGLARGPARIVVSPDQLEQVAEGDVLVAVGVDPGWTPVFGRAGALVMEVGGQLSHAAVVAREYHLPAVTGVSGATRAIKEGDEVLVDGLTGRVEFGNAEGKNEAG